MSVSRLNSYLQNRGVSVHGYLKPALVEVAASVNKTMLPLNINLKEKVDLVNEKFSIDDVEIENPFNSKRNLVNNFADSPPFGLYDIFNYLIYNSSDYDKQGLTPCKSFEEYLSSCHCI